jgi:hypothetical protein
MGNRVWFRKSTQTEKITWLLKHQSLWDGFSVADPRWQGIVEKMREDGLIAESTYWKDVQVWNLVVEARKLRRSRLPRIRSDEDE